MKPEEEPGSDICILIVEDEPAQAIAIKYMLGGRYTIHHALNARDALRLLYTCNVSLVLVDVNLGDKSLSGFHLTDYLRKQERFTTLPVIAISVDSIDILKSNVAFRHFDYYLQKPLERDSLHEAVEALLNGYRD